MKVSCQDPIKTAIDAAMREKESLDGKLKEMEKIKQRISQLDSFIKRGKILIGIDVDIHTQTDQENHTIGESHQTAAASQGSTVNVVETTDEFESMPIHERAAKILSEAGHSMKLDRIAEEFHKRGWGLSSKHGKESIRMAFRRKPDIFSKEKDGSYSLKERTLL